MGGVRSLADINLRSALVLNLTRRQLIRSVVVVAFAAVVILVTIVLSVEYSRMPFVLGQFGYLVPPGGDAVNDHVRLHIFDIPQSLDQRLVVPAVAFYDQRPPLGAIRVRHE